MTEREIFFEALEMATPESRAAYLQAACGGDVALRRKVEELLKEHYSNDSLLAGPALEGERTAEPGPPASEAPAQMIGRYKLLERIGEGGFGEVWMAEQREPVKRRVALKIIKLGMDSRQVVARFEAERQALAMMDHANIAKIFDAGTTENPHPASGHPLSSDGRGAGGEGSPYVSAGRPYFVMELVRGLRITEYCDQNQLPTKERLDLFIKVCQAIQHAHQKGVIHRDIKPSNILVTLHDGVPVPKVIDFGIAKATQQELTDKTVFTQFQQFIGTPAYISPEQAEMSGLDIDTRADIYSLGVLLYELLVGQTPFDAKEMMQGGLDALRQIIREKEPLRPSTRLNTLQGEARTTAGKRRQTDVGKLVHQLQGDLDWIVMKCLEKDRTRRYDTANGLAADLKRHLKNEPVVARPPSTAYQFQKLLRRNKVMSVATLVVLTVILVGTGISITQTLRAQRELRRALAAESEAHREKAHAQAAERIAEAARQQETGLRVRAEAAERATEQQLYTALLEQARARMVSGELGHRVRTLDALQRASAISNTVELRREAFAALGLVDLRFERALPTGPDCTMAVLDPRFERFAMGRGTNAVEIRAVSDQRLLASLSLNTGPELAEAGQWSADGRFLAVRRWPRSRTSTSFARVEIWEAGTGRNVLSLPPTAWGAFSFHPSLPRILAADTADTVSVWDLEHGGKLTGFSVTGIVHHVEFSPDGSSFVVQHRIEKPWFTSFYDAVGGILRTSVMTGWIDGIAWDPQDRWIAFAAREGDVTLYDRKQDTIRLLGRHRNGARTAMFNPAGDLLFTGGGEQEIICWDLHLWHPVLTVRHRSTQLQFRADGQQCALITRNALQLCTLERPAACRELAVDLGGSLQHAAISPDGRWLAVSGLLRLGLWDLTREAPPAVPFEDENPASFFSPDSTELFAFSRDKFSRWRIHSVSNDFAPPDLAPLAVPTTGRVYSGHFTSNSLMLGTQDGMLVAPRADITSNVIQHVQVGYARGQLSPDGVWMAVRKRRVMLMYPVHPWKQATNVGFNGEELLGHVFTPGGTELAVATPTGVTFLNTNRWQPQRKLSLPLDGTTQAIFKWNFMPDGSAFWLAYDARTAALHDARTFETLLPLPAGTIPLAVSPNGRHLVVSVDAQRLQVWDLIEVHNQLRALGLDWTGNRIDSRVAER